MLPRKESWKNAASNQNQHPFGGKKAPAKPRGPCECWPSSAPLGLCPWFGWNHRVLDSKPGSLIFKKKRRTGKEKQSPTSSCPQPQLL